MHVADVIQLSTKILPKARALGRILSHEEGLVDESSLDPCFNTVTLERTRWLQCEVLLAQNL